MQNLSILTKNVHDTNFKALVAMVKVFYDQWANSWMSWSGPMPKSKEGKAKRVRGVGSLAKLTKAISNLDKLRGGGW